MNEEHLKVIRDLQHLLGISYQEGYKIVEEYIKYGDVDLSDFEEIDEISQLKPKQTEIMLDILSNQDTLSLLNTNEKEIMLNILSNQENISYLTARDKEVVLSLLNNKQDIKQLSTIDKEILLNILNNNIKIDLLTTKSSEIDLDISKSDNDSVQLLNVNDKELSIDIEFGLPNTPSHVDLDNINPLSISSISSIHEYEPNVNSLDILSLNNVRTIKEIELEELNTLSLGNIPNITRIENTDIGLLLLDNVLNIPNIDDLSNIDELSIDSLPSIQELNMNTIDNLSLGKIPNIHEFNLNEIDTISLGKLPSIQEFNLNEIDSISLGKVSKVSMKHKLLKYMPYLTIGNLPNITSIDIQSIDTLQLSKLDNFKWGRINARVKRNDLPLLSLNSISNISSIELSELDEQALFDIPELPNFDIQPIEKIEYEALHLDDNLDILNEIIKSNILPPVTKEDFIKAGADPDTVHDLYDTYRENSQTYNKTAIDVFFQYTLAAADEAIANGGKEKGLYKIVTEERGTFLPFITELYMTELCQYDNNPGLVIQEYLKVIKSFLVVEAERYNIEGEY